MTGIGKIVKSQKSEKVDLMAFTRRWERKPVKKYLCFVDNKNFNWDQSWRYQNG